MVTATTPDPSRATGRRGDELQALSLKQGEAIGTLLFGRRIYEGMAAWRPRLLTAVEICRSRVDYHLV